MTLDKLNDGDRAIVRLIHGGHRVRQRLGHIGVHPGDAVRVVRSGFFGGPVLVSIHGFELAIGRGMAGKIEVEVTDP
jgi:Fe2+ transport system protein FeoA